MINNTLKLSSAISQIPLIGPAYVKKLEKLDIKSVKDLLFYIPFRYDDFSVISKIASVQEGETITVQGKIIDIKNIFTKRGFALQQAKIEDNTGTIEAVWFNQRFLTQALHAGDNVSLSGKIKRSGSKLQLESPVYEIIFSEQSIHTGRLVPIYSETAGITSKWLRSRINWLLSEIKNDRLDIPEFLDDQIKKITT